MSSPCCPTDIQPAINNYKGVGTTVKIDKDGNTTDASDALELYLVGNTRSDTAIVVGTDIFGATANAKQFSDALATATGYLVVMPSLIVDPWDPDNIPPTKGGRFPPTVTPADGTDVLMDWILNNPDTRLDRNDQIQQVRDYVTKDYAPTVSKFGAVGMCWGGKVCFGAAHQGLVDAVATCHGSFLTKEDAEQCNVPMCLLNSKDEPESYAIDIKPVMEGKSFHSKNVFKDYPTVHHGWMGTRGIGAVTDFTQQEQLNMFAQGIADLTNFFKSALVATAS